MIARLLALWAGVGCLVAGAAIAIPPVVRGTPPRCPVPARPVHVASCGATGSVAAGFLFLFVALACFTVAVVAKQEMGQAAETSPSRKRKRRGRSGDRDDE